MPGDRVACARGRGREFSKTVPVFIMSHRIACKRSIMTIEFRVLNEMRRTGPWNHANVGYNEGNIRILHLRKVLLLAWP